MRRNNGSARQRTASDLAGDWRLLLLVGNGLLLQVAHPVIGAGVGQHSSYATDPYGRFARSVWPVLALVMLPEDELDQYAADLRAMHRGIAGTDHEGRSYHAWDPEAMLWVLATAMTACEQVGDTFGRRLAEEERIELFRSWRRAARAMGIPERSLPDDLASYRSWYDHVVADRLEDHPTAREVLGVLRRPTAPPHVPEQLWRLIGHGLVGPLAALVTVGTLPAPARASLGLRWTRRDQLALKVLACVVRAVALVMPPPLRDINARMVARQHDWMLAYAAQGATLGRAPSMAG